MPSLSTIIDLVHPASNAVGVFVTDTVWVLFDSEVDEQTVRENFFIEGPEPLVTLGIPVAANLEHTEDILTSPDYKGIVEGTITFERINNANLNSYSGFDYSGSGNLFRLKAIFTPTRRLSANTTYRVYLSGDEDETDTLRTGIKGRSVFDTQNGANLGDGVVEFGGGYDGAANTDVFRVEIITGGSPGEAEFQWYRDSAPTIIRGSILTSASNAITLQDNVYVRFLEGTYEVGDTFLVYVKKPDIYTGNVTWEFETGSGSIQTLPTTTSTSVIGDISVASTDSSVTGAFQVLTVSPANRATNQSLDTTGFTVTFNGTIDEDTVTDETVEILIEPVNGDMTDPFSGITYSTNTGKDLDIDDDTLTVTLSGILYQNNIVTLVLDSSIADEDGNTLGADFQSYFTTVYNPLYSSVRKVRLEAGSVLADVPNDTINLAIFEASRAATMLSWNTSASQFFKYARLEWVTCKALEMLLVNMMGLGGGVASKRLADLEVSYHAATSTANDLLDRALACMGKWEGMVNSGGRAINPTSVVKGELDPDRPLVGRLWTNNDAAGTGIPAVNVITKDVNRRRWERGYSRYPGNRSTK